MIKGDWKKCSELIMSLKIYNHYKNQKDIKVNINEHIKETSLKCYLIFYSNQFSSLSLPNLSRKFGMEVNNIRTIINNMILEGEVEAQWNDSTLELYSHDNNVKMIKRLEENLNIITEQNLTLLELTNKNK